MSGHAPLSDERLSQIAYLIKEAEKYYRKTGKSTAIQEDAFCLVPTFHDAAQELLTAYMQLSQCRQWETEPKIDVMKRNEEAQNWLSHYYAHAGDEERRSDIDAHKFWITTSFEQGWNRAIETLKKD